VTVGTDEPLRRLLEQTVFAPVRQGSAVADTVARLGRGVGMGLLRPGDFYSFMNFMVLDTPSSVCT